MPAQHLRSGLPKKHYWAQRMAKCVINSGVNLFNAQPITLDRAETVILPLQVDSFLAKVAAYTFVGFRQTSNVVMNIHATSR